MTDGPHGRLTALGLELPPPFAPVATYQPAVLSGNRLYVSGQGPVWGSEIRYRRPDRGTIAPEQAHAAAQLTVLNVLAHVDAAVGLDRVKRAVGLFGLVNAPAGHGDAHTVIAAGAEVLHQVFGEAGRCAVSAISASSLPFEIAVEMDGVFEIA